MTEKQFYDWQTVGGTDDVMRYAASLSDDLIWRIAENGDGFIFSVVTPDEALRDKIDCHSDQKRRQSKRIKDLADIARLVESHPELWEVLPTELRSQIDQPVQ
ncbi:MAG: hypothetical protein ABL999_19705 [Pyrinomonadaceae bacterium]